MDLKSIGFITNKNRPMAVEALYELIKTAKEKGLDCFADLNAVNVSGKDHIKDIRDCEIDMLTAIGGDGTILRASQIASHKNIPILGVNLGRIGFLSEIESDEFPEAIESIRQDKHYIERKSMLECRVNETNVFYCLNDIILYKPSLSGVALINIAVDGQNAGSLSCDGVIVSTPTGSTGYSISAGGPVIADGLDAAIITPICPHSLSYRPIVAGAGSELVLMMRNEGFLSVDGQQVMGIGPNDIVKVSKASVYTDFIRLKKRNIYDLIRKKLT
jgi:NAD+ kinase